MIPNITVEKINSGKMTEDEFRIVALEFAKIVVERQEECSGQKKSMMIT